VKPGLPLALVQSALRAELGDRVLTLHPMAEGLESQVFGFGEFVVRVNAGDTGFAKDAYAYRHFASAAIPVPEVVALGRFADGHAYCVSRRLPGVTLQDSPADVLRRLRGPVFEVWQAIAATDVSGGTGFGPFGADGTAPAVSWRAALGDPGRPAPGVDRVLFADALAAFVVLADACPEVRRLYHGDFGSNNVLTDGRRVTGVLDWEGAGYSDPLVDVAYVRFWRTWLPCMRVQADDFDERLAALPGYRDRVRCYALGIALRSLAAGSEDDPVLAAWLVGRTRELLDG